MKANGNDVRLAARWKLGEALGDVVRDETGHGLDARVIRKGTALVEEAGDLAGISPAIPGVVWSTTNEGDLRLTIPAGENPLQFTLKVIRVPSDGDVTALARWTEGGPAIDLGCSDPRRSHPMARGSEIIDQARRATTAHSPSIRSDSPRTTLGSASCA